MRNEAHRFGITFHRDLRSKDMLESELEHIPHVAKKSAEKLLIHFKSISNIRNATLKQLTEVVNLRQAQAIQAFFEEAKGEEEDMEKAE